jgi:hypothetical protein
VSSESRLFCSQKRCEPLCFFCSLGQVNQGNLAMLKMDFQGVLALKGRQDQLDILALQAHPVPLDSVTLPSVPTLPALLPGRVM